MIIYISLEEAQLVGIHEGSVSWEESLIPLAKEKGFPTKGLFEGSYDVSGIWDEECGLYLSDRPGGFLLDHASPIEIGKWVEKHSVGRENIQQAIH